MSRLLHLLGRFDGHIVIYVLFSMCPVSVSSGMRFFLNMEEVAIEDVRSDSVSHKGVHSLRNISG